MKYLTNDDLTYLSAQNQDKMNMVVYGMTALMDETNDRVQQLESQTWFQRMSNTLTGKNKMTVNEIANNRDKINVYLSEAISCLYDQNKINENMILGLGNRLNELYAQQIEIKQMIGAFVTKLNQKIISIDNFHMLTEEINQGVYSADTPIVSICMIVSKLDARTVHDSRKMGILLRAMEQNGLLSDEEVLFVDFLQELLKVSEADSGVIAMMFENAKDDYVTEIALDTVCQYYMLPDKVRKMKSRKSVAEAVLVANQIDLDYAISTKEYYESLIECLTDNILLAEAQNEELANKNKTEKIIKYFEDSQRFFEFVEKMFSSWDVKESELHSKKLRSNYISFVSTIKMFCSSSVLSGTQFFSTLNNFDNFIQSSIRMIDQNKLKKKYDDALSNLNEFERGCICCNQNGIIESEGSYYSLSKYVQESITSRFLEAFKNFDQLVENKDYSTIALCTSFIPLMGSLLSCSYILFMDSCLKSCVNEIVGETPEKINDLFDLTEKFPVVFDADENSNLIRVVEEIKDPYISFEYRDLTGQHNEANHTSFWITDDDDDITIVIHFNNMDKTGTIHYSVLENSAFDFDTFTDSKKYKISWGEWVGKNACELKLNKLVKEMGTVKIKVWADYDPACTGIIEGN